MTQLSSNFQCGEGSYSPVAASVFTACLTGLFGVITILGNSLVCLAVYIDPFNKLRTPFSYYILNLAFSDLIVGLVAEPISVVHHVLAAMKIKAVDDIIVHLSFLISCTASVFSLAALCIDRYFAMTSPIIYRVTRHKLRALLATMLIWMASGLLPPIVYYYLGFAVSSLAFVNGAVIFTFLILIFTCGRILHSRKALKRSLNSGASRRSRASRCGSAVGSRMSITLIADCKAVENHVKEKKVTSMFAIMVAVYLLCYVPSVLMVHILNFCRSCSCDTVHWLKDAQFLFILLSSLINPFLYCWRLPSYREALFHILRSNCRKEKLQTSLPLKSQAKTWNVMLTGDTVDTSDSV